MPLCEYCGVRRATHFCERCHHWVCSHPWCVARAVSASVATTWRGNVHVVLCMTLAVLGVISGAIALLLCLS